MKLRVMAGLASIRRFSRFAVLAACAVSGSASAVLLDRGPLMVYDDVLDITWTRQASDGIWRNWHDAAAAVDSLVLGGYDDWRMPWASVAAGAGPVGTLPAGAPCTGAGGTDEIACRDNELAYMYFYNLDGTYLGNKEGTQTAVGGQVITGLQPGYWSGTSFNFSRAYFLYYALDVGGAQSAEDKASIDVLIPAWAVRDGDVMAAIPEPQTYALLLAGLALLGFAARRRRPS